MIKSHVLYRLSYALTLCPSMISRATRYVWGEGKPVPTPLSRYGAGFFRIMLQPALCRGQASAGQ